MGRASDASSFVTTDEDGRRWAYPPAFLDGCAINVHGGKVTLGTAIWGTVFDRGTREAAARFAAELLRFRGDDRGAEEMLVIVAEPTGEELSREGGPGPTQNLASPYEGEGR